MPLKKVSSNLLLIIVLMLCGGTAPAQARQAVPASTHSRPFAGWVGRKFFILPDPGTQEYSYTVIRANGKSVRQFDGGDGLYFSKFARKVIICIAVQPERLVFHVPDYNIDIAYSLVSYTDGQRDHDLQDFVESLAPLTEIDAVRRAYLGKTVWVINSTRGADKNLPWHYDAVRKRLMQELSNDQGITLPRGTQLTVTDVRWGDDTPRPVWLIVRDSAGHYFCYEVAANRTNKGLPADTPLDTADRCLSTTRPSTSP